MNIQFIFTAFKNFLTESLKNPNVLKVFFFINLSSSISTNIQINLCVNFVTHLMASLNTHTHSLYLWQSIDKYLSITFLWVGVLKEAGGWNEFYYLITSLTSRRIDINIFICLFLSLSHTHFSLFLLHFYLGLLQASNKIFIGNWNHVILSNDFSLVRQEKKKERTNGDGGWLVLLSYLENVQKIMNLSSLWDSS